MNEERPFDAHAIYLSDQHKDKVEWRTISLVLTLKGVLEGSQSFRAGTIQARLLALRGAADELTLRGLDATSLVRYGMWQSILGSLMANLLATRLAPHWGIQPLHDLESFDHESWAKVLNLPTKIPVIDDGDASSAALRLSEVVAPLIPQVISWISVASLEDLVQLTPPTKIHELTQEEIEGIFELQIEYQWAVDYFSKTFFHEWETSSLRLTHRWIKGFETPPCNPELMDDRRIDVIHLSVEIADRVTIKNSPIQHFMHPVDIVPRPHEAVKLGSREVSSILMRSLSTEMTKHARRLLTEGRYREAAAVFEFGVQGNPEDPDLYNNWGFCLVPVDPHESLKHLSTAEAKGFKSPALNVYNQMCCLVALNRQSAALRLASNKWDRISKTPSTGATIWEVNDSFQLSLGECDNLNQKVAELAMKIAVYNNSSAERTIWESRSKDIK